MAQSASLCRSVHTVAQFDGPISYFLSCDDHDVAQSKVVSITQRLQNPPMKPTRPFLSHVLSSMDRFNHVFQNSTENTTFILYSSLYSSYSSYTHCGPQGFQSRIDHCLTRQSFASSILDCQQYHVVAPVSDHKLMKVKESMKLAAPKKANKVPSLDYARLKEAHIDEMVESKVCATTEASTS